MRLADPERSRAVLIGTARYEDPALEDIPAVAANVADLADVLTDPELAGFRPDHVHRIVDPDVRAGREIARRCRQAEDVLVVYFAGHGLVDGSGGLLLALTDTEEEVKEHSALPIEQLRSAIAGSPARVRILIVDCCYSGRALPKTMADEDSLLLGQIDVAGTFALASAPRSLVSLFVPGERHTMFSGALIRLLRDGLDNHDPVLTLPVVYHELTLRLRQVNGPSPKVLHTDTVSGFALVRNRAYRPAARPREESVGNGGKGDTGGPLVAMRGVTEADALATDLARRIASEKRFRAMAVGFRLPTAVDDLSNAATDPTWPILARLRFAWMLANIGEADRATAAFYALGSSFNPFVVDDVLTLTRNLADDEQFVFSASGVWDVADLVPRQRHTETVDPRDLWGLAMAMLLAAAGLPDTVRLRALAELDQLGHRDEAVRIARGMLRERRGNDDMVSAVRAYLRR